MGTFTGEVRPGDKDPIMMMMMIIIINNQTNMGLWSLRKLTKVAFDKTQTSQVIKHIQIVKQILSFYEVYI